MPSTSRCAVIGVGNALMGDDAVGVAAVEALRAAGAGDALVIDAGTALFDALPQAAECERVVIVDCLRAGGDPATGTPAEPGSVYRVPLGEPARVQWQAAHGISAHELSVLPALQQYELAFGWRPETVLIGVEPERIGLGEPLSPAVAKKLPRIIELVRAELRRPTTPPSRGAASAADREETG